MMHSGKLSCQVYGTLAWECLGRCGQLEFAALTCVCASKTLANLFPIIHHQV